MTAATPASLAIRELLDARRAELDAVFLKYGAVNPRLFGSVARGDANPSSDIDILVDLLPNHPQSELIRVGGLNAEVRELLGRNVDVVALELMRSHVSKSAVRDAIQL